MELQENLISDKPNNFNFLDEKIEKAGFKFGHSIYFLVSFLLLGLEGAHIPLMGTMIIPIMNKYSLSTFSIQLTSALIFLGIAAGSLTLGFWTNSLGRRSTVNISNMSICLLHLIFTLVENIYIFVISRIFIGYFLGLIIPISINVLCEVLPVKNRAIYLTAVWLGIGLGMTVILSGMLLYMPQMETSGMERVFMLLFAFILGITFLVFQLFKDSPRNLILVGSDDEGFRVLEDLLDEDITPDDRIIIKEIVMIQGRKRKSSLREYFDLFNEEYRLNIILLTVIWILVSFIVYGPILILSVSLDTISPYKDRNSIITTMIGFGFLLVAGNLIGGFLTEVQFLGRRITMVLAFTVSCLFNLLLLLFPRYFNIFLALTAFFSAMGNNITNSYGAEIFPTKIRDVAMGFLFFNTRVGGFASQFLFYGLFIVHPMVPYILMLCMFITMIIMICLLPNETRGQAIDHRFKQKNVFSCLFSNEENET